jgi:uncharacterized membrane protein YjjP (DUF1212 family)
MDYTSSEYKKLDHIATLAVEIGTFLLACGAHCGRISRNLNRIVNTWGVTIHIHFSYTGILVTAYYDTYPELPVTIYKRSPSHGVNFNAINEISQLSWLVASEKITVDETFELFTQIRDKRAYSKSILLAGIGMSCACLCIVAGGDWRDAIVAFIASIAGMLVRLEIIRKKYNPMISFTAAAFTTSFITCLSLIGMFEPIWGVSAAPDRALATAVLYLVPGVPLTNCIIDLIEGYIPSAIARGVFGSFILLCIAAGMSISILLFGINNF